MKGYFVETSREHYQCSKYGSKTQEASKLQTVFFKHKYITMLEIRKADAIFATAHNLTKVLQGEMTTNIRETNTQQITRLVKVSDMILAIHSDASYLIEQKARGKVEGHFFMSTNTDMDSKIAMQIRHTLASMGHPQPTMPIQTNNSTAYGAVTNKMIHKATKAMYMTFIWLHDCKQLNQFWLYLQLGPTN